MRVLHCEHEADVAAAVTREQVEALDPVLRTHVSECAVCREVADIAGALRALEAETTGAADIPGAGQVWWRARMRARADAQRIAARPVLFAQAIAAASVLGILAAVVSFNWEHLQTAASAIRQPLSVPELSLTTWLAIGMWMILAPVVIYFAVARE